MGTVQQSLKGLSSYPVPGVAIEEIAISRGLDLAAQLSAEILRSKAYQLAKADVKMWLASAPSVSQSGISYSFTDSERKSLKRGAKAVYMQFGEKSGEQEFGYLGEDL